MIENDDVFDALGASARRRLLVDLLDRDQHRVPPLTGASREMTDAHEAFLDQFLSGPGELDDVDKELVRSHHVHLPKLAEYGFVEWYPDVRVVTKGPRFDEVRPLLEWLDDRREEQLEGPVVSPR